jgi:hypothetical protein
MALDFKGWLPLTTTDGHNGRCDNALSRIYSSSSIAQTLKSIGLPYMMGFAA